MPVRRLSEVTGRPPSRNWTHVSGAGYMARVCAMEAGNAVVVFNDYLGRLRRLPTWLFKLFWREHAPGGCAARWDDGEWHCELCVRRWAPGHGIPPCHTARLVKKEKRR